MPAVRRRRCPVCHQDYTVTNYMQRGWLWIDSTLHKADTHVIACLRSHGIAYTHQGWRYDASGQAHSPIG